MTNTGVVKEQRELDLPTGRLQVQVDSAEYALDQLLGFAARANAKRGFLFLSKVLGKHWPVSARDMHAIHCALAAQIQVQSTGPVVFISMAETAIGLGQGVFEAWLENHPNDMALFLHSSRYRVGHGRLLEFEEAHSHAPRQFLHLPNDTIFQQLMYQAKTLVLIDDEISTGNTFVNLCNAYRLLNQKLEAVHLVTIANFLGREATDQLSQRFGLPVTLGAALHGQYQFCAAESLPIQSQQMASERAQSFDPAAENGANPGFGRLGVVRALRQPSRLAAELAHDIAQGERILVLGTGEFMHPAFLLGRALEAYGHQVMVQSTTRSPILEWGAVTHSLRFADNYSEGISNYLYNVVPGAYQHVLICHETPPNPALFELAKLLAGRLFYFKSETLIEEIFVC